MTQTHVLHVVPGLLPGGMELAMARVISGLNSGRMRHSIACLKEDPQIADRLPAATDIHCMHSKPNELQLPVRLARLIRRVRPTVIHARNWGAWPDTAVGRLLGGPRISLVLSFHGLGKADYMPRRRRAASWILARMATGLFAVSNQSKELMVAKWGWPERKVEVLPNGVDTDRFLPGKRCERRERTVVGTVGNLRTVKNHPLLIRACGELVRRGLDIEIRIAGEGEQHETLTALAKSEGLGDRLKLFGRVEDVPGFLQQLDIFVLSSDSEQHPNCLNEAMACGLPCVATRVGCVEEMFDEGRCGTIVTPGDHDQMVAAIDELIVNPARRQPLGSAAREHACEHYSMSTMLAAYDSLYTRLSSGKER